MKIFHFTLFLIFISLLLSCGVTPGLSSDYSEREMTKRDLIKTLKIYDNDFSWFHARAKISVDLPNYNGRATAQLRIKKDSIIWAQVSKYSVEIARVLITQDSIFMIDRMNKQFLKESIVNTGKKFGIHLDYSILQNALIGAPLVDFQEDNSTFYSENDRYILKTSINQLVYSLELSKKHLLPLNQEMSMSNQGNLRLEYDDYTESTPLSIATKRNLQITETLGDEYHFDFSQIDVHWNQAKKTRFSIPPHYERIVF